MYQMLAILTGIILTAMISINGNLSAQYGVFWAAVIIHIVGILFAALLCAIKKEKKTLFSHSPKWIYLGGAIGVCTTLFNNLSFGHISMTSLTALGLLGQTVTSLIIDHFGLFGMKRHPFQKKSIIGFAFAMIGIAVMLDYTVTEAVLAVIFSLSAGISVVLSRTVNARLSEKIGALHGSLINHLVGFPITVAIALFLNTGTPVSINTSHPWIYCGGMLGVIVVLLLNLTVPKVPAFKLTILSFLGQLFTGILFDLLTGNGYSDASFLGGIIISVGILLNMLMEQAASSPAP